MVHAGLRPNVALHSQTTEDLTELRTLGTNRECDDGKPWYELYQGMPGELLPAEQLKVEA